MGVAGLAFPDCQHFPAVMAEFTQVATIPRNIARAFGLPESGVGFRRDATPAAGVHMPIAAVDIDNLAELWKYDVGCPWKIRPVETKAKTETVGNLADDYFRLGVLAPDGGHVPASLLWGVNVRHEKHDTMPSHGKEQTESPSEQRDGAHREDGAVT